MCAFPNLITRILYQFSNRDAEFGIDLTFIFKDKLCIIPFLRIIMWKLNIRCALLAKPIIIVL